MGRSVTRDHYLDNVKGVLIFLVVLGHTIEKYRYGSPFIYYLWIFIYIFHMPLFVFVTGYFRKDAGKAAGGAFARFLLPYFIWNTLYQVFNSIYLGFWNIKPGIPWWAYWFFVSMFTLSVFLPVMIKIRFNILVLFGLSLLTGNYTQIGDFLALSRTICFAGFFLMGFYCRKEYFERLRKRSCRIVLVAASLALCVLVYFYAVYGALDVEALPLSLVKSVPYRYTRAGSHALLIRAVSIPAAMILGALLLAIVPSKESFLGYVGRKTLVIFIFHEYLCMVFDAFVDLNPVNVFGVIWMILAAGGITLFLSIGAFHNRYQGFMKRVKYIIVKE
ncbi:MAG: acyltransferase family protein [Treponema sp.]|nr:acyltransferase family protein [Treponema sp.]